MKYRYFFFYEVKVNNIIGHFNTCLELSTKISGMKEIQEVQNFLAQSYPGAETVLVCYWQYCGMVRNGESN